MSCFFDQFIRVVGEVVLGGAVTSVLINVDDMGNGTANALNDEEAGLVGA